MRGSGTALLRVAGGSAASELIRLSGAWRRSFVRAEAGSAAPVQVSVEVSGQSSMEVFGPQLEAQPHPSAYKVSGHRSGVYAKARFSGDRLLISHEGPGRFAARCSIVASQE